MNDMRKQLPDDFSSLEQFWQFWDTHSSADYEDLMEPVAIEIDLRSSKRYCAIARDVLQQVRLEAQKQGVSTETLINLWLRERLSDSQSPESAYALRESSPEYTAKESDEWNTRMF